MKEKLSYLRQTFDMLYLKHFTSKTEEYVFKLIRNFSRKRSGLLNFASTVGRRTSEAILWSKKTAMNKLKNNEKDFLKAELFFDLIVAAITTQQKKGTPQVTQMPEKPSSISNSMASKSQESG